MTVGSEPTEVPSRRQLILILGGARAGKSAFAHSLAAKHGGTVTFLATAEPLDEEMRRRIEEHRRRRPAAWRTVEAPLSPARALRDSPPSDVVLLDCLTLLVSNLLQQEREPSAAARRVEEEIAALLEVFAAGPASFIIVSNEVGLGVVPAHESGRLYRDLLGRANQRLAHEADQVFWLLAGLAVEVKASGLAATGRQGRVQA